MSMRLRKRELRQEKCYAIGNGVAQNLLHSRKAFGYTSGEYGWDCDVYIFSELGEFFYITTGYRPIGVDITDIARKYDELAVKAIEDDDLETYNQIGNDFIKEIRR